MVIKYKELRLCEAEEVEDRCYSIPLEDNRGDVWVGLDEDNLVMFMIRPDWEEILESGFTDDDAAPVVEMSDEDQIKLITYLKGGADE